MVRTLLKQTLHLTDVLLKDQFAPPKKSLSLSAWLDPERYPDPGSFNMEDTREFLPDLYRPLVDNLGEGIDWRSIISRVVTHNEQADARLEKWVQEARFTDAKRREAFHSIPFIPGMPDAKLGKAPRGTLWSFYVIPLLLTKRRVESMAIRSIYRRSLDYTELYSPKYDKMVPDLNPPPVLIVNAQELPNPDGKPFTLIEGVFRTARAEERGQANIACKIISWSDLEPYVHIQPIQGSYQYALS